MTAPDMVDHDNAYEGLLEADDDARWAFGTGFDDPLAGIDTRVPAGVDGHELAASCLMLGDDALVLAQRLVEWTTHAPEIEEEVSLANIALDLLGQARLLLARAAVADPAIVPSLPEGSPVPDDDRLAYFRDAGAFRNVHLVEQPNGDFAATMVRLLVFSTWRLAILEHLRSSDDPVLAAIAEKAVKEVRYHEDHAARWCVILARGTDVSRRRMVAALDAVWPDVPELAGTVAAAFETTVRRLDAVLDAAGLQRPVVPSAEGRGRDGVHTEAFVALLAEMQSVARAHPTGRW
jgi:ring-1,2-phenylacetyl-CoA epoxidase subunit PaaC